MWIDTGAGPQGVIYAGHLDADVPGALVLRSYLPWEEDSTPPSQVWIVEWAGPFDSTLPRSTAHRTAAGARAHIAAVASELGVEAVEQDRPGTWIMTLVGELAAMMWSPLELQP